MSPSKLIKLWNGMVLVKSRYDITEWLTNLKIANQNIFLLCTSQGQKCENVKN